MFLTVHQTFATVKILVSQVNVTFFLICIVMVYIKWYTKLLRMKKVLSAKMLLKKYLKVKFDVYKWQLCLLEYK